MIKTNTNVPEKYSENHSLRVNIGTATLCFASRDLAAGEEVLILLLIVVLVFVLVHLPILPIYIIVVVDVVLLLVFVLVLLLTMRISSTPSFTFSPIQWSLFYSRPCAQCSSSVIFVLIFIVINNLKTQILKLLTHIHYIEM